MKLDVFLDHLRERLPQRRDVPLAVPQLVDEVLYGLLRRDPEGLIERAAGPRDAQRCVEDYERHRYVVHDRLGVVACDADLLDTRFEGGDVRQDDHRAVDLVVRRRVGPNPQRIPAAVAISHLALDDGCRIDHVLAHLLQVGEIRTQSDVPDRPADVRRDEAEHLPRHGSKPPDPPVAAEHDDGNIDADEQVVQIVVEQGLVGISVLQLLVHGRELFVDRLELLLRGLELLIRALQFLVARLELLVGRLQLLVGRFPLLDDVLQELLGRREFLVEVLDLVLHGRLPRASGSRAPRCSRLPRRGNTLEEHEVIALPGGPAHRDDFKRHLGQPAVLLDAEPLASDRRVLLPRLVDRHAQLHQQAFPSHLQEVEACLPGGGLEIWARVTAELKDLWGLIDEDAGGGVFAEEDPVDLLQEVQRTATGLARTPRGPADLLEPLLETDQAQVESSRGRLLRIDPILFVDDGEEIGQGPDGLRHPEHQEAGVLEGIVEDRQHALLQLRLQVDEHVAAHDEVHLREGRIGGQIVPREDAELAHRLADLMLAIHLHEEAPQPRPRDIELDIVRVDPGARLHDRGFTDIASEQLDRDDAVRVAKGLEPHDGQRVGFLSRRTPRRPDADRRVRRPLLEDARKEDRKSTR